MTSPTLTHLTKDRPKTARKNCYDKKTNIKNGNKDNYQSSIISRKDGPDKAPVPKVLPKPKSRTSVSDMVEAANALKKNSSSSKERMSNAFSDKSFERNSSQRVSLKKCSSNEFPKDEPKYANIMERNSTERSSLKGRNFPLSFKNEIPVAKNTDNKTSRPVSSSSERKVNKAFLEIQAKHESLSKGNTQASTFRKQTDRKKHRSENVKNIMRSLELQENSLTRNEISKISQNKVSSAKRELQTNMLKSNSSSVELIEENQSKHIEAKDNFSTKNKILEIAHHKSSSAEQKLQRNKFETNSSDVQKIERNASDRIEVDEDFSIKNIKPQIARNETSSVHELKTNELESNSSSVEKLENAVGYVVAEDEKVGEEYVSMVQTNDNSCLPPVQEEELSSSDCEFLEETEKNHVQDQLFTVDEEEKEEPSGLLSEIMSEFPPKNLTLLSEILSEVPSTKLDLESFGKNIDVSPKKEHTVTVDNTSPSLDKGKEPDIEHILKGQQKIGNYQHSRKYSYSNRTEIIAEWNKKPIAQINDENEDTTKAINKTRKVSTTVPGNKINKCFGNSIDPDIKTNELIGENRTASQTKLRPFLKKSTSASEIGDHYLFRDRKGSLNKRSSRTELPESGAELTTYRPLLTSDTTSDGWIVSRKQSPSGKMKSSLQKSLRKFSDSLLTIHQSVVQKSPKLKRDRKSRESYESHQVSKESLSNDPDDILNAMLQIQQSRSNPMLHKESLSETLRRKNIPSNIEIKNPEVGQKEKLNKSIEDFLDDALNDINSTLKNMNCERKNSNKKYYDDTDDSMISDKYNVDGSVDNEVKENYKTPKAPSAIFLQKTLSLLSSTLKNNSSSDLGSNSSSNLKNDSNSSIRKSAQYNYACDDSYTIAKDEKTNNNDNNINVTNIALSNNKDIEETECDKLLDEINSDMKKHEKLIETKKLKDSPEEQQDIKYENVPLTANGLPVKGAVPKRPGKEDSINSNELVDKQLESIPSNTSPSKTQKDSFSHKGYQTCENCMKSIQAETEKQSPKPIKKSAKNKLLSLSFKRKNPSIESFEKSSDTTSNNGDSQGRNKKDSNIRARIKAKKISNKTMLVDDSNVSCSLTEKSVEPIVRRKSFSFSDVAPLVRKKSFSISDDTSSVIQRGLNSIGFGKEQKSGSVRSLSIVRK